jgi:murein DD-endopeptidase MepM/ murein hydrolase activator NlpD
VSGTLSSPFGRREGQPHDGIDLAVPEGTPVRAACDGRVAYAGDRLRGYGRLVIVAHAGGLATVYAHNSRLEVQEGEPVARGQEIARSGQTGRASAPHVHFEVRRDNHPEDPLKYLPIVEARRIDGSQSRPDRRTYP